MRAEAAAARERADIAEALAMGAIAPVEDEEDDSDEEPEEEAQSEDVWA